jgi:hypothetical protein
LIVDIYRWLGAKNLIIQGLFGFMPFLWKNCFYFSCRRFIIILFNYLWTPLIILKLLLLGQIRWWCFLEIRKYSLFGKFWLFNSNRLFVRRVTQLSSNFYTWQIRRLYDCSWRWSNWDHILQQLWVSGSWKVISKDTIRLVLFGLTFEAV